MPNSQQDLIETVSALPAKRQLEVKQFIQLLNKDQKIVEIAMEWIVEHLPDRYCVGEPRFDVDTLNWHVPVLLSYPNRKSSEVGELVIDARVCRITGHTKLNEIRKRGRRFAQDFEHAR
ncbi:MAG: hypothetical protein ACE5I1_20170 [bacterium]